VNPEPPAAASSSAFVQAQLLARTRGAPLAFGLMVTLILALQFGPAIGLLGFRVTGSTGFTLVGVARDGLVIALVALAAAALLLSTAPWRAPPSVLWALLLVAMYTAFAVASPEHPLLVALNLRRLALVPLLFVALLLLPWSRTQLERLVALVLASSLVVALLGLAERFSPDSLWTSVLDIGAFMASNPLDPWGLLPFEDSGRFFSWDLEPQTGLVVRRLVSTYLEPTTLAPTLAMAMLLALASRERRHLGADPQGLPDWASATPMLAPLFLVAGLLTVSKGFIVFLGLLLAWRWLGVPQPRQVFLLSTVGIGVALAVGEAGFTEGAFSHMAGLATSVEYLLDGHLLGEGLGAAGNYAFADTDVGTESGLGNGIAQVGLAALLPLLWLRAIALEVWRTSMLRRDPGGPWIAAWLLLWFLTYLLSASSLGVGGNALGFAMLALYLHPAWGATPASDPGRLR
jgi:hypothetical protein